MLCVYTVLIVFASTTCHTAAVVEAKMYGVVVSTSWVCYVPWYDRLQGPAYCSKLNSTKVLLSFHEGHPIFNGAIHTCIKKFEARLLLSSHFSFVPCFAHDEN